MYLERKAILARLVHRDRKDLKDSKVRKATQAHKVQWVRVCRSRALYRTSEVFLRRATILVTRTSLKPPENCGHGMTHSG